MDEQAWANYLKHHSWVCKDPEEKKFSMECDCVIFMDGRRTQREEIAVLVKAYHDAVRQPKESQRLWSKLISAVGLDDP